jgi:hypothetical protein
MSKFASAGVGRPRGDDRPLWDIILGVYGYQAVLLAHELGLFPLLAGGHRSIEEIAAALNIVRRPAQALLQACLAVGLVREKEGRYHLTPVAEEYLLEESPVYFGGFLDYTLAHRSVLSYDSLKKAVLTNTSQVYGGEELYTSHQESVDRARAFTRMMHSHSMAAALVWPEKIDLSGRPTMLDIGGGSGAHSIGAALRWPELGAIILDLPSVCEAARDYLARYGVQDRVRTHPGDMWNDPFPSAEIHFYSEIFHDFTPEKCRFLTAKSFASLPSGGRLIVHEMLYNSEKTGPFTVAGFDVSMLLWTEGQQFSGGELAAMLAEAGFADVAVTATLGYWGIVTGRKP